MSKLVNELLELEAFAIKNMSSFSSLAIEYATKNSQMSEDFFKFSKQEERKAKKIQNHIESIVDDQKMFNFIIDSNVRALSDAKYLQGIYTGIRRG